MSVKIIGMGFSSIDPKDEDYENMSDSSFYFSKLAQSTSVLTKAFELTPLMHQEKERINKIAADAPPIQTKSGSNWASATGPLIINRTSLSALEFSLLLIQFTHIEALVNIVAEIAIRKNKETKVLHEAELHFLMEQKVYLKKGKIETDTSFVSIEEKIKQYPKLLAKACKDDFQLDTSKHYWSKFLEAKKIRNEITHPKNGVISQIKTEHLFDTAEFIYWYNEEVFKLFAKHCEFSNYLLVEQYSYRLLYNINALIDGDKSRIKNQRKKHMKLVDEHKKNNSK